MDHLPINHRLRPLWRGLAFLTGVYILVFGILGFIKTRDLDLAWTAQEGLPWVLGLRANPAFSTLSIAVGAVVIIGALIGRNIDRWINLIAGAVFMLASMLMLLLLRTDLNYLGFGVSTCVVSAILGLIMFTAGLYGRVGSVQMETAEEARRHRTVGRETGVVGSEDGNEPVDITEVVADKEDSTPGDSDGAEKLSAGEKEKH
ncbi:DUF4383 domain-containing protein [Phytomonospora sp. NPDC050363]|uniref:DUF4383 domain-containing protein n=1 Tax=Phytomonospora sp. NPDC050363 TaxID=3155642 RepID=UPI0033DFD573